MISPSTYCSRSLHVFLTWVGVTEPNLLALAKSVPKVENGKVSHVEADDERWVNEQSDSIYFTSCLKKGGSYRYTVSEDMENFKKHTLFFWTVSI